MEEIIVFGTGKYFEYKRAAIEKNYNIVCFLDNKVSEQTYTVYRDTGIKVINPKEIEVERTTRIFLMSVHFVSMWRQLCKMGINPKRLVFPYKEKPYFENEEALCGLLDGIEFGIESFSCIQKNGEITKVVEEEEWSSLLRTAYRHKYPFIRAAASMEPLPISRQFGTERGTPIDRYYIEQFLEEHKEFIQGDVLEIEDNSYTIRFGQDRVKLSVVMDVSCTDSDITFNGNLETGDGIREEIADCFILTQTLMYIYDLKSCAHHISRLLKKDGVVLITCSGISQNSVRCMDNYGCYFNFNEAALIKMFEQEPSFTVVESGSLGNVKTVISHLGGLCCEDLKEEDFKINDKYYPLIVYAVVKKN